MKKIVALIVVIGMLVCFGFMLVACTQDDASVGMETDLTIDYDSDIGLYFYAQDGTYKRYTSDLSNDYFDTSKPTVVFFHGWMTDNYAPDEICDNAASFAPRIIEAGYNFCSMDYCHHAKDIFNLFPYIWSEFDGSHSIACRFAREFAACFKDYNNDIRFLSHSYGAHSSVATAYLLSHMADEGIIGKNCLPSRMTFADPYLGDIISQIPNYQMPSTIENINEPIGDRGMVELFADCFEYLANEGIVLDVYAGMPFAYDQYLENEPERRAAVQKKMFDVSTWTILTGLQAGYGVVGDIHMITLDWVFDSYFVDVKCEEGVYYPTASLPNDIMITLKGKFYNSTLKVLNVEYDTLYEVDRDDSVVEENE